MAINYVPIESVKKYTIYEDVCKMLSHDLAGYWYILIIINSFVRHRLSGLF